ncbi:hypothetical protein [Metapseudomonas boanensis]|uniref:Uncharacterized protein n=1 Tax=Metapseudomonas boanensis TaxID=2822138 RepID=A0ABS5XH92_9GAMM|nr:hypothetical protein [Pseudomonas boanensis]MBT8767050.1 hypothetical protein [Pseudomonas boanensis]
MSACKPTEPKSRRQFHQEHAEQARAEALRLLEQREALGARWLAWVANELYHFKPPEFANMVRRELERLSAAHRQFGDASQHVH